MRWSEVPNGGDKSDSEGSRGDKSIEGFEAIKGAKFEGCEAVI